MIPRDASGEAPRSAMPAQPGTCACLSRCLIGGAFVAWHTPGGSCGKFLDDLMMVKWVTCKTKIGNAVDALSGTFRAVSRGYTAKLLSEGNKARLRMECGLCAARCCCPRCAYALHPAARRWFVCKYLYHTLSKFLTRRANFRSKSPAQNSAARPHYGTHRGGVTRARRGQG